MVAYQRERTLRTREITVPNMKRAPKKTEERAPYGEHALRRYAERVLNADTTNAAEMLQLLADSMVSVSADVLRLGVEIRGGKQFTAENRPELERAVGELRAASRNAQHEGLTSLLPIGDGSPITLEGLLEDFTPVVCALREFAATGFSLTLPKMLEREARLDDMVKARVENLLTREQLGYVGRSREEATKNILASDGSSLPSDATGCPELFRAAEIIYRAKRGLGHYRLGRCEWQRCRRGPDGEGPGWFVADTRARVEKRFCSDVCGASARQENQKEGYSALVPKIV